MNKTYNGRFDSPEKPKGGTGWIIAGLALIPTWPSVFMIAASIGCFIKGGKMNQKRKMYERFHELCAVIGMREHVPVKELAKVSDMSKSDMLKYLQRMIAEGYFGRGAYLDVVHELLILPSAEGQQFHEPKNNWKDIVMDILNSLRGEKIRPEPKKQKPAGDYVETEFAPEKPRHAPRPAQLNEAQKPQAEAPKQVKAKVRAGTKKTYMDELEKTLNELYELNEKIEDEAVSRRIDRIGTLTAGIFTAVIENPAREADVRKFMNYYLPQTLKLLKSYDMLEEQHYQSENITASRQKIENVLDMLIEAYEKQLDRLFHDEALDIATDIDVLETMMAGDGLSNKGMLGKMN